MLRFYAMRVLKDYLGHIILIGLPVVLIYVNMAIQANVAPDGDLDQAALFVGLVFILMFQVFGAAYTTEGMEFDFFTPFKDRLRAAPVHPVKFLLLNMVYSSIISFLQLMVLLVFIVAVYSAPVVNWPLVVAVILFGVVFTQTFAAVLIILAKKAGKAQAVITLYAVAGSILAGHFFPLPENAFTNFLRDYSSPIAWQRMSIEGFIDSDFREAFLGLGILAAAWAVCLILLFRLSKRVVA